jgi:predicted RNase H-like HicB family nuclease
MQESFEVELELEEDGRWIGEAVGLPGVLAYGSTPEEAVTKVKALVLEVMPAPSPQPNSH